MKFIIPTLIFISSLNAYAHTANVTVEYCTSTPKTQCRTISNVKAAQLLRKNGYETVDRMADKLIRIHLRNGCIIADTCQSGQYVETATVEVFDNATQSCEISKSIARDVWPRTSITLLKDIIDML